MNTLGVLSPSSQLQKMKEKKGLYPDKSVYTQQIGPGFCFGALALMLRFFFEVPVCTLSLPASTRDITKTGTSPHTPRGASSLAQGWNAGIWQQGQGSLRACPHPIPALFGAGVTASGTQGDALSLFPPQ